MGDYTQPEPININELKRLLIETVDLVLTCVDLKNSSDTFSTYNYKCLRESIIHRIDNAILDGDDS